MSHGSVNEIIRTWYGTVRFLGQQRLPGVAEAGCFWTTLIHMGVWRKALGFAALITKSAGAMGLRASGQLGLRIRSKKMRGEVFFLLTKTF